MSGHCQTVEQNDARTITAFIRRKEVLSRIDEIRSADAGVILYGMRHGDENGFTFIMGGNRENLELH